MKIIAELLKMKFPTVDINSLMEIISATPNPEIATEIMCGIYSEPTVGSHTRVMHKDRGLCIFISYDKWSNEITYSYEQQETKGAYFPKGTLKEEVTMENFNSLKVSSSGDSVWYHIPTGNMLQHKGTMCFASWMELPYVPTEAEVRMLEAQNLYC
ncbi:MAG: hypothetical protein EBU90_12200 [Proteobacteria bacterium]|nr:hypothetical protein [Pseudomonadota bacterium]